MAWKAESAIWQAYKEMKVMRAIIIAALLTARFSTRANMTRDKLVSMEKSNVYFKSKDGVVYSDLRLTEEDMAHWRDLKFGIFIHLGLYALAAQGEWVMYNESIPTNENEYAKLADEFDPQCFDAAQWAQIAKGAGMEYMVLTAQRHDRLTLGDSPSIYGNFTSVKTAAQRDFVKEYVRACREADLKVGLFYSLMVWRFPRYFKPKELLDNALKMKQQYWKNLEELCLQYGPIDILWYDGGWLTNARILNLKQRVLGIQHPAEPHELGRNYQHAARYRGS